MVLWTVSQLGALKFNGFYVVQQHLCQQQNGGCEQLCIPSEGFARKCECSVGYMKEDEVHCTAFKSFAIVSQLDITRGFSLKDSSEAMVPISGPGDHRESFLLEKVNFESVRLIPIFSRTSYFTRRLPLLSKMDLLGRI